MSKIETLINNSISKITKNFNNIKITLGKFDTYFNYSIDKNVIEIITKYYSSNYGYSHINCIRYTLDNTRLNIIKSRNKSDKTVFIKSNIIETNDQSLLLTFNNVHSITFSNSMNFHNEEELEIIQFNISKNIKLNIEHDNHINKYKVYLSCQYDSKNQDIIEELGNNINRLNDIIFNSLPNYKLIKTY